VRLGGNLALPGFALTKSEHPIDTSPA
jgi:hypothetical protein